MMAKSIKNWVLVLGAVFLITACGVADDTVEARLTQAQIEIDAGNYTDAVTILAEVCDTADLPSCEDTTLLMLAEAYMGSGGVDLLDLLADAAEGASPDTFTMIQTMAGGAGAATKVTALGNSILALEAMTVRDANAELLLAVATTTRAVMTIMDAADTGTLATAILADVEGDLEGMLAAVEGMEALLGESLGLTDDLDALIAELGGTEALGDVTLDPGLLQDYLDAL